MKQVVLGSSGPQDHRLAGCRLASGGCLRQPKSARYDRLQEVISAVFGLEKGRQKPAFTDMTVLTRLCVKTVTSAQSGQNQVPHGRTFPRNDKKVKKCHYAAFEASSAAFSQNLQNPNFPRTVLETDPEAT